MTAWVDPEGIVLSDMRRRKTNTIRFHLYMESKKQNNQIEQMQTMDTENILMVTRWEGVGVGKKS